MNLLTQFKTNVSHTTFRHKLNLEIGHRILLTLFHWSRKQQTTPTQLIDQGNVYKWEKVRTCKPSSLTILTTFWIYFRSKWHGIAIWTNKFT